MDFSTLQNQKENKSRYWMKRGNSDIKMHIKAPTRCYQHVTHFIALHFLHAFTHSIWTMSEEQFIRGLWVDSKLWGLLRISISMSVLRTYFFPLNENTNEFRDFQWFQWKTYDYAYWISRSEFILRYHHNMPFLKVPSIVLSFFLWFVFIYHFVCNFQ